MISTYFSTKILSDAFLFCWLLFWSLSCLKSSGRLLGTISTKFRANPRSYNGFPTFSLVLCYQTRWKLIPGVPRSFLNSSGTKITAKNMEQLKFKFPPKIPKNPKNRIFIPKIRFLHQNRILNTSRVSRSVGDVFSNIRIRFEVRKRRIFEKNVFDRFV